MDRIVSGRVSARLSISAMNRDTTSPMLGFVASGVRGSADGSDAEETSPAAVLACMICWIDAIYHVLPLGMYSFLRSGGRERNRSDKQTITADSAGAGTRARLLPLSPARSADTRAVRNPGTFISMRIGKPDDSAGSNGRHSV